MSSRETFDTQLKHLMKDVLELCDHAISSYELALQTLLQSNTILAHYIIEQDKVINRLEQDIHDKVILLITRQQPVATDLRRLIMQIKVAGELERIGDYAVNIAKEIIKNGESAIPIKIDLLTHMFSKSITMLKSIVEAYSKEDVVEAREFAALDDEIDELYFVIERQLLQTNPIQHATSLLFIAHFIERVADHATNIAEHLLYLKNGKHYDLN